MSAGRSLIFTFAPESTVAPDFPQRTRALIQAAGGKTYFIRLTAPLEEQERRIDAPTRAMFGKLRSLDLLRELRPQFEAAMARMPDPLLTLDTATMQPKVAAQAIAEAISG